MNSVKWSMRIDFLKNIIWSLFLKLDINSKPLLFPLIDTINDWPNSNLYNWRYYFKSKHKESELANGDVACIMCTWMEEKMVPLAIESSKDFVNRYIIVDKDGKTVPVIESCRDKWNLDMEIYVKPKMSLRESRAFALSRINEPWILIQDGDEIFHTDGPNALSTLRYFMERPNILLMTPMNRLCGDLLHVDPMMPSQPSHAFLYHNNGTLKKPRPDQDLLSMDGWKIYLTKPYKFNCVIKSPRRMFLRQFWKEWCKYSEMYFKYPNIEKYVSGKLQIDIDDELDRWYNIYLKNLIPYDDKKSGYYPKVIREYIRSAKISNILLNARGANGLIRA